MADIQRNASFYAYLLWHGITTETAMFFVIFGEALSQCHRF